MNVEDAEMRKLTRNRQGVSVVISSLLMLAIVVAMGSLAFLWTSVVITNVIISWDSRSARVQEAIFIEEVYLNSSQLNTTIVYVRNIGTIPVKLGAVYISSSTDSNQFEIPETLETLSIGELKEVPIPFTPDADIFYTIKVVTLRGTSDITMMTASEVVP